MRLYPAVTFKPRDKANLSLTWLFCPPTLFFFPLALVTFTRVPFHRLNQHTCTLSPAPTGTGTSRIRSLLLYSVFFFFHRHVCLLTFELSPSLALCCCQVPMLDISPPESCHELLFCLPDLLIYSVAPAPSSMPLLFFFICPAPSLWECAEKAEDGERKEVLSDSSASG